MARPKGYPNITLQQIEKIVNLTKKGYSRPAIAKDIKTSKKTVWMYQKKLKII